MKKLTFKNISNVLSREEMKEIMAGSHWNGGGGRGLPDPCYICIGGIHCYQVEQGQIGKDRCVNLGWPNFGCDTSGGSRCVGQ